MEAQNAHASEVCSRISTLEANFRPLFCDAGSELLMRT